MSTTVRGKRGERAGQSGPLAPRSVRTRDACVRHAAERLGLESPTDDDLRGLGDETGLRDAVAWWQARSTGVVAEPTSQAAGVPLILHAILVTAVTVVGLALSYGRAQ